MNPLRRLHALRVTVTGSLWFVPGVCVVVGLVLAIGLMTVDVEIGNGWIAKQSRLFGVGAEGARGMLAAIAGSMMTVASLTFSLTISTLATASSQYTSRLIRNFMRDRVNQFVLGYFVGLFGYCLAVLRSIRNAGDNGGLAAADGGGFVPSLAVFGGLVLAIVSIGVLIYFIHHIAESIQASVILDRVTAETVDAIAELFPAGAGDPANATADVDDAATDWHRVAAGRSGYVQSVDTTALLKRAAARDTIVRMAADIGAFVTPASVLCEIARPGDDNADLRDAFTVGSARTIEQDPAFGVRQIVDIALKALSPGINDTTTGVMCVEHLAAVLEAVARRPIPDRFRATDGTVRLVARGRTFGSLLRLSLDQIRVAADGNVAVLVALFRTIANTAGQTDDAGRRALIREQARLAAEVAAATLDYDDDRDHARAALTDACRATATPDETPTAADRLARQWLPPAPPKDSA